MTTFIRPPRVQRVDALADEICRQAADLAAGTCRWLELIAEFDALEPSAELGARSTAEWLAHTCSMQPGAAREHVRVARRLAGLPLCTQAFRRGELTYSKMRALTRLPEVEDEAVLLDFARSATAAELERSVAAYRSVEAMRGDPDHHHRERFLDVFTDENGAVVLRGRLSPEEGALFKVALDAAFERLSAERRAALAEGERLEQPRAVRADALVAVATERLAEERVASSGGDRTTVLLHVDVDGLQGAETDDGLLIGRAATERLCCDAGVVPVLARKGRTIDVGRKTRTIPPPIRRALRRRDRHCRFPGCRQSLHLDGHHIVSWMRGGRTELDNLVHLCRFHHRCAHEGGFTVRRIGEDFEFRRPGGRVIGAIPRLRGDCTRIRRRNLESGLSVSAETCGPHDRGWDPLDLGAAVDVLWRAAPPPPPRE